MARIHEKQLASFFDEFEKISGIAGIAGHVLEHIADNPVLPLSLKYQHEQRKNKPTFSDAVREGYPATWVALGMRPTPRN